MAHRRAARLTACIVAALIAGAMVAHARLGEDEAGCDLRYNAQGGNVETWPKGGFQASQFLPGAGTLVRTFSYEGWAIVIGFRDGHAARLRFRHEDPTRRFNGKYGAKIAEAESNAILTGNTGGSSWREVPSDQLKQPAGMLKVIKDKTKCDRLWVRHDGAVAYFVTAWVEAYDSLYIEDRTYVREHYSPPEPEPAPKSAKPVPKF